MSVSQPESGAAVLPDFSSMTEEEQIAYAMQMSLAGGGEFYLNIRFMLLLSYLLIKIGSDAYFHFSFSEYGEMDTGAPMDTAESAKVSHHNMFYEAVKQLLNGTQLAFAIYQYSSKEGGVISAIRGYAIKL